MISSRSRESSSTKFQPSPWILLSSSHSITRSSLGAYPSTILLKADTNYSLVRTYPRPPITIDTVRSISRPHPPRPSLSPRPALDMLRSFRVQVRGRSRRICLCSEWGVEDSLVGGSRWVFSGRKVSAGAIWRALRKRRPGESLFLRGERELTLLLASARACHPQKPPRCAILPAFVLAFSTFSFSLLGLKLSNALTLNLFSIISQTSILYLYPRVEEFHTFFTTINSFLINNSPPSISGLTLLSRTLCLPQTFASQEIEIQSKIWNV